MAWVMSDGGEASVYNSFQDAEESLFGPNSIKANAIWNMNHLCNVSSEMMYLLSFWGISGSQ